MSYVVKSETTCCYVANSLPDNSNSCYWAVKKNAYKFPDREAARNWIRHFYGSFQILRSGADRSNSGRSKNTDFNTADTT